MDEILALKSCPFCGRVPEPPTHMWNHVSPLPKYEQWVVSHHCCPGHGKSAEEAISNWNRRTPPNPSEPLGERVTNAILFAARDDGYDSPVDYGDAEGLAKAAIAALPAPADDVEWQARCRHLLACLDSCDEAQGLPSELDPDDAALIRETRAALAKVKGDE